MNYFAGIFLFHDDHDYYFRIMKTDEQDDVMVSFET